jgi:hypothetical protein
MPPPKQLTDLFEQVQQVMSRQLFFVAGAPKSGTTWLQRLLDAHPEIMCAGEGHFVDKLAPLLRTAFSEYNQHQKLVSERVYEGNPYYKGLTGKQLDLVTVILAGMIMAGRPIDQKVRCIGDKTPRYTLHLDDLRRVFPTAKFIHIVRDGRDVVISTCYHVLRTGDDKVFQKDAGNFYKWVAQFTNAWANNVRAAEKFGQAQGDSFLQVRYEDLHDQPAEVIGRLLAFLGVDDSAELIARCQESASFEKLSGGRKPGEEKAQAFMRKGAVGDWRNHFDDRALEIFERSAGNLLRRMGYGEEQTLARAGTER